MSAHMQSVLNPLLRGLRCMRCGRPHEVKQSLLHTVCEDCSMPLGVEYALAPGVLSPEQLAGRAPSLWRYAEVLPIGPAAAVSLVEGMTPLVRVDERLWIKDESRNPTGSFKARGLSLAVSMARWLGARALCAPSAGNAAGALAAYGAAAGLPVTVAMPDDTPRAFVEECRHFGAEVHLVPGTISDAARFLREQGPKDAFDVSTLREPYRIEGKKTMAYELWEQMGGALPDVILYPTGGGTGLVGMWRAFSEMADLGWPIGRRPRLVSVQAEGCAPVVRAFETGADVTSAYPNPATAAYGLRVPAPIGGFLCLRALRETAGTAVAVTERAIADATRALAIRTGLDICPEGGAAYAAMDQLRARGWLKPAERVVLFNTGTGLKYR
jgi:threonine synthase